MEKNSSNKRFTPKSLVIGLGLLVVVSAIFLFMNDQAQKSPTAPTPVPTGIQPTQEIIPTTEPDKQIEGQIVVKFKPEYTDAQIAEYLKKYDASIIKKIERINYTVVKVPKGKENEILEKIKKDPQVEKASGDYTGHTTYIPNDEHFPLQYGLRNTGQAIKSIAGKANADLDVDVAWDVTQGNGVKVGIVDSGIDVNHPEFAGKIIAQKVFTTSATDPDMGDKTGHGTHVAGIITAATNNGKGIAGTCPGCQLIIAKVVALQANGTGSGPTSNITQGIVWVADQGAKVINISIRSNTPGAAQVYQDAVNYANSKGAVVVVAAGNDSTSSPVWPAANTGVLSVGAIDNTEAKADYSNYGNYVKVAAPGTNIVSTYPTVKSAKNVLNYGYNTGTSMASPMVAGVAALVWASPYGTSNTAVINRIYATADKIAGTGTYWTEGRVNAGKAVGAAAATATTGPSTIAPTFVCAGSPDGSVCPPTPTVRITPPITGEPLATAGPDVTTDPNEPTLAPDDPNASPTPTTAAGGNGGGGNPGQPCPAVNQMVYNRSYNSSNQGTTQVKRHMKDDSSVQDHKRHRGGNRDNGGGILSRFFEFLFKLLELIFRIIGIGNPCLGPQPPIGSPNPNEPVPPNPDGEPGISPNPENPNPTEDPNNPDPVDPVDPNNPNPGDPNNPNPGTDPNNPDPNNPNPDPNNPNPGTDPNNPNPNNPNPDPNNPNPGTDPNNPPPASGGGVIAPPPVEGGPGGGNNGGGDGKNGGGDPNTPAPGGYTGQCKADDEKNGFSYCVGDGPNSGKCLPPGGACGAPTTPYSDGNNKGAYCIDPTKQEFKEGSPRGTCTVCPKGGSVKPGAKECTCEPGNVESKDGAACVKQIEGCDEHAADGKCTKCGNGRVLSSDGMKCEVPPPPPPPPPPPAGGGGGGGGGGSTCSNATTRGIGCTCTTNAQCSSKRCAGGKCASAPGSACKANGATCDVFNDTCCGASYVCASLSGVSRAGSCKLRTAPSCKGSGASCDVQNDTCCSTGQVCASLSGTSRAGTCKNRVSAPPPAPAPGCKTSGFLDGNVCSSNAECCSKNCSYNIGRDFFRNTCNN